MKKTILVLLILFVGAGFLLAQTTYDEKALYPLSAEYMAQGGSFVSIAHGYNSLFTNPAGFAMPGGSLTLAALNAGVYADVPKLIEEQFASILNLGKLDLSDIGSLITTLGPHLDNGFGPDIAIGLGFAGKGLGLGVVASVDAYMTSDISVDANATLSFVAGLAFPISIGETTLYLGADVRPMIRATVKDIGIQDFMTLMDSFGGEGTEVTLDQAVLHGLGVAIDAGAIWDLGAFQIGVALRDLGAQFSYRSTPLSDFIGYIGANQALPGGGEVNTVDATDTYAIPLSLSVGAAFHPDLGGLSHFIDPMIHVEYKETFYSEDSGYTPSFLTKLHAGAEVKLLSFLKLRAGINQGYITAGAGFKLLILDINAAIFSNEMGLTAGADRSSGLTVDAAIRF